MTRTAIALQQLREQERANRAQEGIKSASNIIDAIGTGLSFIPGVASGVGAVMRGAGALMKNQSNPFSGFKVNKVHDYRSYKGAN